VYENLCMKIYFAGISGGGPKGEKELIDKTFILCRLFSYYFYCVQGLKKRDRSDSGNLKNLIDTFNLWIKKQK